METKKMILTVCALAVMAALLLGCGDNAALSGATHLTPEGVVESFYTWYLGYPGNPMADRAYRTSEYLSADFVRRVDELTASFEHGGYDPFLLAQDIPDSFTIDGAEIGEDAAVVGVRTSFPGHLLRVELTRGRGRWQITAITRDETALATAERQPTVAVTPEMVVENFYRWYIYSSSTPFLDAVYRSSPYLTVELVQELDQIRQNFALDDSDPLLCSSDVPADVSIARTYTLKSTSARGEQARVIVRANLEELDFGYDFAVNLDKREGEWKIAEIGCLTSTDAARMVTRAPTSAIPLRIPTDETQIVGWQVFRDDVYEYKIEYPSDWVAKAIPLHGSVAQTSIKRVVSFAPRDWTEMYSPVILEVSVGTLEEFRRVYPEPAVREAVTINGNAVMVEDSGYGLVRYVFENARNRELRVTLQDMISKFPDRASGNENIVEVIGQMIETLEFTD